MVRNPYAIRPKQPAPRRLPTVRIAPDKAAAFRALARQQGLTPTAALAALVAAHADIRQPFGPRVRAKHGPDGMRYGAILPDPKVSEEVAKGLIQDARTAGISLGEAMRQLVDRCLEQSR
ncbi:hypothetical protein [Stenotrophomonas maltophilia]|uniref:hypothetical protein n=1 Tax=Stenotrophomonas maltophilia TaxID=40324 RepID=UPI00066ECB3E|nr:hypothetical protein [Stenotrophomonas maltophilia]REC80629.1 hypothetical protein DXK52_21340 [Stenotrophomonas maltophilia]HDS1190999.1 hypothetical protein [Stenotrophomonas maltophilia]HDS1637834.1 hypothetical protein [Stenotrophomonas maltophilia]HDS1663836.1 hypothetical protein [Stenotrophomonas maltophilia]HEL3867967.1 hypothetical protein [Stenotrophomonas maltophilia]